jgi:hypothetical protein
MYKLSTHFIIRLTDGASIPKDEENSDYKNYLAWLEEGNTPEPQFSEADALAIASAEARKFRKEELNRADIMLNRVQDGEKGIGTQKAWREYRVALRNWPDTEDFPATPPVAPF